MATTSKKPASKKTKTARKVSATTKRSTTTKKTAPKRTTKVTSAATKQSEVSKSAKVTPSVKSKPNTAMESLRSLNMFVVFASAVQAALILWMSKAFSGIQSINASFPTNDSLASATTGSKHVVTAAHRLFDVHLSWIIAAYFIVCAIMHLALATWMRKRYEREIDAHINRTRWATYAVSGSLLLVTIALAAGITDFVTLLAVVAFNVIASLVALSREHYTQNGERTRLVYGIGALAAASPWAIFLLNVLGTHQYGEGGTSKYIYWLYATGLVLVAALARNLLLQTRARGRWIDYVYAEKVYIWLSLLGSSAVAWQIYSAVLSK